MKARVIRIGNSTGVIIPSRLATSLRLKKGDSLATHVDAKGKVLSLSKVSRLVMDETFIRRVDEFSTQYRADLEKLAQ